MRITSPSTSEIRFPWVAAAAPIIMACVMWAVTGTPLSLLFGAMSPFMVVAHFVDGRRSTRRRDVRDIAEAEAEHPAASKFIELVEVARKTNQTKTDAHSIRLGVTLDGRPFVIAADDGVVVEGAVHVARDVKRAITAQSWWSRMSTSDGDDVVTPRAGNGRWLMTVTPGDHDEVYASVRDRDSPAKPPITVNPDRMTANDLAQLRSGITERDRRPPVVAQQDSGIGVVVGSTFGGDEFALDLVHHGPHAVVSGMTGSGKTSFIVKWMLALADQFTPDEVEFAIIDFKGGLDFTTVCNLPHCVGVATDTEPGSVDRALGALSVEMCRREKSLKRGMPVSRLVVVLDEFRATAAAHPLAVPTVVDLTARGRALGVHVIMSTQRAASSISEDILANVPLRIAFRSLSTAESRFVVGSDIAHTSLRDPGDAIIAGVHDAPVRVRMNASSIPAGDRDLPESQAASHTAPIRRLWAPALPHHVTTTEARLSDSFVAFGEPATNRGACIGVMDVPALQSWRSVWFDPHVEGHLLITGSARSGRTTAVRTLIGGAQVRWVRDGVELWDELDTRWHAHRTLTDVRQGNFQIQTSRVIVIDGLEAMLGEIAPEFRDVLVERFTLALRQTADRRFVVSCDADGAWALRLGGLFPNHLELVVGPTNPGRARWHGHDLQVAVCDEDGTTAPVATQLEPTQPEPTQRLTRAIVVTRTPPATRGDYLESLAMAGLEVIHAASPDEWMRDPAHLAALATEHAIVIAGDASHAELRMLLRHLAPVPPVRPSESLVFAPDGTFRRVG